MFWVEPSQATQATQSKETGGHRHPRLGGIDGWDETTFPAVLMRWTECDQGPCLQGQRAKNGYMYFHGIVISLDHGASWLEKPLGVIWCSSLLEGAGNDTEGVAGVGGEPVVSERDYTLLFFPRSFLTTV